MLGVVGDLVEDVVVQLRESVNIASDTAALITHRRGGSAANVAASVCAAGGQARFIGQVGDDAIGRGLTADLAAEGVDVVVRRSGRSGTVIALLDIAGERTMLSDRGACIELTDPDPGWLEQLDTLHIPFYSLVGEPLTTTTRTLAAWATNKGIAVSIDTSSAAVLEHVGVTVALDMIRELNPTVVLANELEAATLGSALSPEGLDGALVVIKQGPKPVILLESASPPREIDAIVLDAVTDTTGAGDAFAAGFLMSFAIDHDPVAAARRGHEVAADVIRRRSK